MQSFLTRHASEIKGTLSGLDRIRFRGTLRLLANVRGMHRWLSYKSVLLKEFKGYAMGLTHTIRETTRQLAEAAGRPLVYLHSSSPSKEEVARRIAAEDGVTEGLVCVLTAVEPCLSFHVRRNRDAKRLELEYGQRKCLHQYFYLIDPRLGWLSVRLQTWFPFTVKVTMNGREWLAQELFRRKIPFERRDNCFVDIADLPAAQRMMDRQLKTNWTKLLDRLLGQVHPAHRALFAKDRLPYYWSADETEWATDVMFRSPKDLDRLYPRLVHHATAHFGCADVLGFLGKRPHVQKFTGAEILTHLGRRDEGKRVRHALAGNSVKMYDKQEWVLRVETTLNQTRQMKVYRASEKDPNGPKSYQRLRKGVADLHRRCQISQKSNERYLEALATVDDEPTLAETASPVCRRTTFHGRSVRALSPLAEEDARLLEAVSRGEFTLQGFRNRDLCRLLFADEQTLSDRQRMTKVTRLIRLLRAHRLVKKVPKTHRYTVTKAGRQTITALLAARDANTRKLTDLAA